METPDLSVIRTLAKEAACLASERIFAAFRSRDFSIQHKPDGSPVTNADVDAERAIRDFLSSSAASAWPITGEEFGDDGGQERYRWLVDPIDGTVSFVRGLPTFGTIVAFEDRQEERALVGVIHLPAFGDTYAAARGQGAFCNGRPIKVAPPRPLRDCLVSTPDAYQFRAAKCEAAYRKIRDQVDHLRGYTDCWAGAMVACGSIDAVFEPYMNRCDIAATEVLVEEAGGLCLIRRSRSKKTALDTIFGSPEAVTELAALTTFRAPAARRS